LEAIQVADKQIITAPLVNHPTPQRVQTMWHKLAAQMQATTGLVEIGRGWGMAYRHLLVQKTDYWTAVLDELTGPGN